MATIACYLDKYVLNGRTFLSKIVPQHLSGTQSNMFLIQFYWAQHSVAFNGNIHIWYGNLANKTNHILLDFGPINAEIL